jgi:hypothetical protein
MREFPARREEVGVLQRFVRLGIAFVGLTVFATAPAPAQQAAKPFAFPIGRTPLELGAGYDSQQGLARGEMGACVAGDETERRDGAARQYSIATLTRAGGRLVVGVHVSVPLFIDVLRSSHLTDAARRLQGADAEAFRDLCGDGFVATVTLGDHLLAEIEVEAKDVLSARNHLISGSWTDPESFRRALEALVKRHQVSVRELPGGSRAAARPLTADELIARALAFPASVTPATAKPYLASFEPYSPDSFSGLPLPEPEEIEASDMVEQVFRDRRGRSQSTASRAAEMRAAQVHRSEPEELPSAPRVPIAATQPEPATAREVAAVPDAAPPAAPAPASVSPAPRLHSLPALVFTPAGELPVFATTHAPAGVYAERVRERDYWVPGAATATPGVKRAIDKARADAPARGATVVVAEVGTATVVMTDAAPVGDTHSEAAGERRAWIAGVTAPNAAERAALAAAIEADAHAK